jgi:hypothetical protein
MVVVLLLLAVACLAVKEGAHVAAAAGAEAAVAAVAAPAVVCAVPVQAGAAVAAGAPDALARPAQAVHTKSIHDGDSTKHSTNTTFTAASPLCAAG